jgi:hypothetical protein
MVIRSAEKDGGWVVNKQGRAKEEQKDDSHLLFMHLRLSATFTCLLQNHDTNTQLEFNG